MLFTEEENVEILPFLSRSHILTRSHKSHLLNSCLCNKIILRLFFTVAAQFVNVTFFFFFCKVRLLRNNAASVGTVGRKTRR